MKLIVAIIRPDRLNEVLEALYRAEVQGLTVSRVLGHGGETEQVETYRGTTVKVELPEKVRLEIGVSDPFVEATVRAVLAGARTGEVGDGKVFVLDVAQVRRIRTGSATSRRSRRRPPRGIAPAPPVLAVGVPMYFPVDLSLRGSMPMNPRDDPALLPQRRRTASLLRSPDRTRRRPTVMAAAEAEAERHDWPMVIAIVDTGGHLVMLHRMEQAQLGSVAVAQAKAETAAKFRRSTRSFQDTIAEGGAASDTLDGRGLRARGRAPAAW